MRTPFRHQECDHRHSAFGHRFLLMTEAERKRHDARILAYGAKVFQEQAKVKTHDGAHTNFAS